MPHHSVPGELQRFTTFTAISGLGYRVEGPQTLTVYTILLKFFTYGYVVKKCTLVVIKTGEVCETLHKLM